MSIYIHLQDLKHGEIDKHTNINHRQYSTMLKSIKNIFPKILRLNLSISYASFTSFTRMRKEIL